MNNDNSQNNNSSSGDPFQNPTFLSSDNNLSDQDIQPSSNTFNQTNQNVYQDNQQQAGINNFEHLKSESTITDSTNTDGAINGIYTPVYTSGTTPPDQAQQPFFPQDSTPQSNINKSPLSGIPTLNSNVNSIRTPNQYSPQLPLSNAEAYSSPVQQHPVATTFSDSNDNAAIRTEYIKVENKRPVGGRLLASIFRRLFNAIGCFLFIISTIVIVFIVWIIQI